MKHGSGPYVTLHRWMNLTFPRIGRCENCGTTERATEYASAEHRYTRWRHDWFELCRRCHRAFDGQPHVAYNREKTHCAKGHPFDAENTYNWRGQRGCRQCRAAASRRLRERRKP